MAVLDLEEKGSSGDQDLEVKIIKLLDICEKQKAQLDALNQEEEDEEEEPAPSPPPPPPARVEPPIEKPQVISRSLIAPPEDVSGWLWKKSGGKKDKMLGNISPSRSNWSRRFFVLTGPIFSYYEETIHSGRSAGTLIPKGKPLWSGSLLTAMTESDGMVMARPQVGSNKRFMLEISFGNRKLLVGSAPIITGTDEEKRRGRGVLDMWKTALVKHHDYHANGNKYVEEEVEEEEEEDEESELDF